MSQCDNMSNLMNQWLKRKNEDCTDNTDSTNKKKINETIVTPSATSGSSTLNSLVTINNIASPSFELDVAHFIKDSNVICSDHDRAKLITMDNLPENDFILPFSVHIKKGKEEKRYLNKSYFEKYKWLTFSKTMSGLYCKFCVLFGHKGGRYKTITLSKFVSKPLKKYSKLLGKDGDLEVHSKNIYHINCVQVADDFMKTFNNPQKEVINLINSERMKQITENRNRLKPIVESIIFLGRQNIPLRCHRDHGDFFENYNEGHSIVNQGNFRELLNYRIKAGDLALENHLKTTHSKATYISPVIQNELIDCCKSVIIENILGEVKISKYYCVIFDETTDISHTSQMSLVLRYLCKGVVKENFVCFIDCHAYAYNEKCTTLIGDDEDKNDNINEKDINFEPKLNGDTLGEIVISLLKNYGLDLQYCVGVGTDGCSVMVSEVRGAVKKIQSYAKNAVHSPCSNHSLNLSISKSSTVQSIRNSVGLMKEILQFFNCSSKRNFVLKTILNGQQRLLSLCETRWTERHDSVMVFKTSIPYIIKSLTKISEWQESDSSSKARTLLTALCSCEFIIAIHSLANILCVTAPVSRILQGLNYDILNAKNCIDDIIFNLENKRTNCLVIFGDIYQECVLLMNEMDIEVKIPRLSKYQTKRSNHPVNNIEEYYRVSLFIPLLENILEDLRSRFIRKENKMLLDLCLLIPRYITDISNDDFKKITEAATELFVFNEEESVDQIELKTELDLWKTKWQRIKTDGKKCL